MITTLQQKYFLEFAIDEPRMKITMELLSLGIYDNTYSLCQEDGIVGEYAKRLIKKWDETVVTKFCKAGNESSSQEITTIKNNEEKNLLITDVDEQIISLIDSFLTKPYSKEMVITTGNFWQMCHMLCFNNERITSSVTTLLRHWTREEDCFTPKSNIVSASTYSVKDRLKCVNDQIIEEINLIMNQSFSSEDIDASEMIEMTRTLLVHESNSNVITAVQNFIYHLESKNLSKNIQVIE